MPYACGEVWIIFIVQVLNTLLNDIRLYFTIQRKVIFGSDRSLFHRTMDHRSDIIILLSLEWSWYCRKDFYWGKIWRYVVKLKEIYDEWFNHHYVGFTVYGMRKRIQTQPIARYHHCTPTVGKLKCRPLRGEKPKKKTKHYFNYRVLQPNNFLRGKGEYRGWEKKFVSQLLPFKIVPQLTNFIFWKGKNGWINLQRWTGKPTSQAND